MESSYRKPRIEVYTIDDAELFTIDTGESVPTTTPNGDQHLLGLLGNDL